MCACHFKHYLPHPTVPKANELAELSCNDKRDHVSQMSMSERSALSELWPVCSQVCKVSSAYSMLACTCTKTQRQTVRVFTVLSHHDCFESPVHLAQTQHCMPGHKNLPMTV